MRRINEEYQALDRSPRALRKFGFTVGGAFLLSGAFLIWRHRPAGPPFFGMGILLWLAALFTPASLKLFHRAWMTFALAMGWIMTRIILTFVFFLVVTPVALLQRLFGKRPLDLAFRDGASSYWELRPRKELVAADYEKQF